MLTVPLELFSDEFNVSLSVVIFISIDVFGVSPLIDVLQPPPRDSIPFDELLIGNSFDLPSSKSHK